MMKIKPILYAKSTIPESMCFEGGDRERKLPITFKVYLVENENSLILIDAGCETMPGFVMEDFIGTVKALETKGYSADNITDVIITHAHHDHIECVKYFKNAMVHIQKDEYEKGRKYIPEEFKVNIFEDEFALTPEIKAVKIGGHSIGSCIVEIENDKTFIIAGDECYLRECLTKKIPTGSSFNKEASKDFVEKYSDEKYTVLLCHDEV